MRGVAQPARMDVRIQCIHSPIVKVIDQVSVVDELPETDAVVTWLLGPGQVPDPLQPSVSSSTKW